MDTLAPHDGQDETSRAFAALREREAALEELHATRLASMAADMRNQHQASSSLGRLDELLSRDPDLRPLVNAWSIRREALAIAAAEQLASDETRLATLLAGGNGIFGKQDRTAQDIHAALATVTEWGEGAPTAADIQELWETCDAGNVRARGPDFAWKLEQDCIRAAETLRAMRERAEPFTASETTRSLIAGGGFHGLSGRVARIASLHSVRRGFGCGYVFVGISGELASRPERLASAIEDQNLFFGLYLEAVAEAAARTYAAALKISRLSKELVDMCRPERTTSSLGAAVRSLLRNPVTSQVRLSRDVGCTDRGAAILIERLVTSGCLQPLEGNTQKNRCFICHKALNL
jgi:hypothetical protein